MSMTQAETTWAAQNIDYFDGSGNAAGVEALTNAPITVYDNYYCMYVGGTKYNTMVTWAAANGVTLESMFLHFANATSLTLSGSTYTLPAGSRVPTYDWYGTGGNLTLSGARVIMNPHSASYAAFNAYWEPILIKNGDANDALNPTPAGPYNGVDIDNTAPEVLLWNNGTINSGGEIAEYSNGMMNSQTTAYAYDADLVKVFAAVRTVLGAKGAAGSYIQEANGPTTGYDVNGNIGWAALYPYLDAGDEEATIQPSNTGFTQWGNFASWLRKQAASDAAGISTMVMSQGLGSSTTDDPTQKIMALAAYYIGTNPALDYYNRADAYGSDIQTYEWYGAMEINVGTPQASYTTFASGTDSGGAPYTVYSREYTNALVLVRVSSGDASNAVALTVNLPVTSDNPSGLYYQVNADGSEGSEVSQISLTNAQGAVLIKASQVGNVQWQ